jgi:hypothetical protein
MIIKSITFENTHTFLGLIVTYYLKDWMYACEPEKSYRPLGHR